MQPQTSADALGQLQQFQQSMKAPTDIINGAQQSLGVPGAQQQVSGLRQAITNSTNLLNQVPSSIMGRTQGSLVTSAQANRQIQNEQAPISQNLNKQEQDYSGANSDLASLLGRADTQANAEIAGQGQKLDFLKSVYDSLFGREQAAADAKMKQDQFAATQSLEQQKLAEQAREANLTSSNGIDLGSLLGLGSSTSGASASPKAPSPQDLAYQDVQSRLRSSSVAQLKSDYAATLKSANFGNAKDKAKVALYQQYRPDLFNSTFNGPGLTFSNQKGLIF